MNLVLGTAPKHHHFLDIFYSPPMLKNTSNIVTLMAPFLNNQKGRHMYEVKYLKYKKCKHLTEPKCDLIILYLTTLKSLIYGKCLLQILGSTTSSMLCMAQPGSKKIDTYITWLASYRATVITKPLPFLYWTLFIDSPSSN